MSRDYLNGVNEILLEQAFKRKSFKCLDNLLKGISLYDFQACDVVKGLITKRGVYRYDTGIGKTIIFSALSQAIHNKDKSKKILIFITNPQMEQTTRDLSKFTNLRICSSDASQESLEGLGYYITNFDVILLTIETLNNYKMMSILSSYKDLINTLIIDEAHLVSNLDDTDRSLILKAMSGKVEYCYALTATPIITGKQQLPEILSIVNPFIGMPIREMVKMLNYDKEQFKDYFKYLLFDRSRKELGADTSIEPHIHFIEPMEHQIGANGVGMFETTKGPGSINQYKVLENIFKKHTESRDKGLVFAWHHSVIDGLSDYFYDKGYRIAYLTGQTPKGRKQEIIDGFNNDRYDILITSAKRALNLDCEYVVMFELTTEIKQVLGRPHRGLNPKKIDLHFLFTSQTAEFSFFRRRIYEPSLFIDGIVGTDFSEIYETYRIIEYKDTQFDEELEEKKNSFWNKLQTSRRF